MSDETALDRAHAAMEADHTDNAARLRFFERLADSELFLLLEKEAEGTNLTPEVFKLDGRPYLLVFDREERLAEFAEGSAPYAALSGRLIATMLEGQDIGMAINLEVAPSSILIPAQAVEWLLAILASRPAEVEARPVELTPPTGVPDALLSALDAKLTTAAGLAPLAYLAGVVYEDGQRGHVLAFIDAAIGAETALANAVNEALTFSGIEAGTLDVAFFDPPDAMAARLAKVGLRFDIPEPAKALERVPQAPGSDPGKPPKLR